MAESIIKLALIQFWHLHLAVVLVLWSSLFTKFCVLFFILSPHRAFGNPGCRADLNTIAFISHAIKLMLKILQARLQQYVDHELPDVQVGFRNGRGTRDKVANIRWIMEKAREFQKNIYFCFIDYAKAFDCVDHNKLWKILRDRNTRPSDLPLEKSTCKSRSNS